MTRLFFNFQDVSDEFWKRTIEYFAGVPELNYMTQIVLMLYEDPQADKNSEKRFHIELHFSPGVKCQFEVAGKDSRLSVLQNKNNDLKPTEETAKSKEQYRPDKKHESRNATVLTEEETEDTKTDCRSQDGLDSTMVEKANLVQKMPPKLEGTGSGNLKAEQLLPGGNDKKNTIISRRQNSGRSRSESEYPTKSLDNLVESSGKRGDAVLRHKAISKSLGK